MSSSVSLSILELLIKGVPEGLLVVWAVFIITNQPFERNKYLLISFSFIVLNYLIRLLPIYYGVNTMIGLLALVLLFVFFVKTDIPKLIKAVIGVLITLFACEEISLLISFLIIGKERTIELLSDSLTKALWGIPSTILLLFSVLIIKKIKQKYVQKHNLLNDMKSEDNDTHTGV